MYFLILSILINIPFVTKFYLFQSESDKKLLDKVNKLMAILGGETTIALHLEFLIRNNHADLLILKNTKVACYMYLSNLCSL